MLAHDEVPGSVEDTDLGVALLFHEQLDQLHAVIQRGGRIVVAPHDEGRAGHAALEQPAVRLRLLLGQLRQELLLRQSLLVHLRDRDLVAFGLGDRDAAVEPVLGDDLRIVGVAFAEPADGFARQLRLRRILEHDMRAGLSGRQASRRDTDAGLHQVGTLQRQSRHHVAAA